MTTNRISVEGPEAAVGGGQRVSDLTAEGAMSELGQRTLMSLVKR